MSAALWVILNVWTNQTCYNTPVWNGPIKILLSTVPHPVTYDLQEEPLSATVQLLIWNPCFSALSLCHWHKYSKWNTSCKVFADKKKKKINDEQQRHCISEDKNYIIYIDLPADRLTTPVSYLECITLWSWGKPSPRCVCVCIIWGRKSCCN